MKLVMSHSTALDLLRAHRCGAPFHMLRTRATSLADSAHTASEIKQFEIPLFPRTDPRIHVIVPNAAMLCDSLIHESHLTTYPLPAGSLAQVGKDVFTASPPLLFLQLAAQTTWLQLALIGCELCGKYSLKPAAARGMAKCVPAIKANALSGFIEEAPQARGIGTAREAIRWIPDLSASPLESAVYLLLTLPVGRGGYGLPRPSMNPPTALNLRNASLLKTDDLHCDIHWREAHIALEYNSKDAHIGQLTHDARRANSLTSEGEHVFTMTPAILANPAECDALVNQIAHMLGHRLRGNALGLSRQREALRAELLPWAIPIGETANLACR